MYRYFSGVQGVSRASCTGYLEEDRPASLGAPSRQGLDQSTTPPESLQPAESDPKTGGWGSKRACVWDVDV